MIILDTNVLSELLKPSPAEAVLAWIAKPPVESLFLTAITEAEVRYGLSLLPAGRRKEELSEAVAAMLGEDFSGRILGFDSAAAHAYADIASERRSAGHPISQFDAQIAAITMVHGATLATRNTRDFAGCRIDVMDPWA